MHIFSFYKTIIRDNIINDIKVIVLCYIDFNLVGWYSDNVTYKLWAMFSIFFKFLAKKYSKI
jgi:hypothetical protein